MYNYTPIEHISAFLPSGEENREHSREAYPSGCGLCFSLAVPRRAAVSSVELKLRRDYGESEIITLTWTRLVNGCDIFTNEGRRWHAETGLYFRSYIINDADGEREFPENNISAQLLIYDADFHTPAPVNGIIYHIFVDRFKRSGRCPVKNGAVLDENWSHGIPQYGEMPGSPVANNVFFGGDLWGVADELEYISSLGTRYIYLSPVFDAASNHKYDTADYENVDVMFGGNDALANLITKAAEYGIGIILDGVFNHTGADSIYFNMMNNYPNNGAYNSVNSPYRKWYRFRDDGTWECWWGVKILPRVNSDEPSYQEFLFGKRGVIDKWMSMGVAGWRLDVADEVSDDFLSALRRAVRSRRPDALLIGEVWEDASNKISYGARRRYLWGGELDSVMNYPIRDAVLAYVKSGDAVKLTRTADEIFSHYPPQSANTLMNILSTHDTERLITVVAGDPAGDATNAELADRELDSGQRRRGFELARLAFALIFAMPGVPCIFYGDEIGMEGYRDPFCRRPFKWDSIAEHDNAALLEFIRELGALRKKSAALASGAMRILQCDTDICAVMRYTDTETLLICVNRSERRYSIEADFDLLTLNGSIADTVVEPMSHAIFLLCDHGEAEIDFITI